MELVTITEEEIVPVRKIPYDYAKLEIIRHIQSAEDRKIYASELTEGLRLDYDLKLELAEKLKNLVEVKQR